MLLSVASGGRTAEPPALAALRVSRCVDDVLSRAPSPASAVVHSVFRRAANVVLDGGSLISLTAPETPLAANGIAIPLAEHESMLGTGLRAGLAVRLECGALVFERWHRVDVRDAARWEPRPLIAPGIQADELGHRLAHLRRLVISGAAAGGFAPLLWHTAGGKAGTVLDGVARAALPAALALRGAAAESDLATASVAAASLAGLGPGLTPSGDDLLAGFLACWALACRALGLDECCAHRVSAAVWAAASPRASVLGRCWLEHSVRAEVSEPQGELLTSLLSAEEPVTRGLVPRPRPGGAGRWPVPTGGPPVPLGRGGLSPALLTSSAQAVLGVGATSGADWLVGVVLGVQAVLLARERAQ